MGLLFHFNFKGETSQVESRELNHAAAVPASRRCVRGRSAPRRWVSPPVDGNVVGVPRTPPTPALADSDPKSTMASPFHAQQIAQLPSGLLMTCKWFRPSSPEHPTAT